MRLLGHDRHRDLGRRNRTDRKPDRRVDARDISFLGALRPQPVAAFGVRLPRAERADIEAVALEGVQQRGIVDLWIVRHRDESGIGIDVERRQRRVGPFRDQGNVGEALRARKGRARIDHGDVVAERARQRCQGLANMDGADDDELGGRRMDVEEQLLAAGFDAGALAHTKLLVEFGAQWVLTEVLGLHQALLAALGVGDQNHRAARGALGIEFVQDCELHG
jgi:hypothetical protein